MKNQNFDTLGIGFFKFKENVVSSFTIHKMKVVEIDGTIIKTNPLKKTPPVNFNGLDKGVVEFDENKHQKIIFDLASLTKPLTLFPIYVKYQDFFQNNPHLIQCLNHQSGLIHWQKFSRSYWQREVMSHPVSNVPCPTIYSDLGPLRIKVEWEKYFQRKMQDELNYQDIYYWRDLNSAKDLKNLNYFPVTGFRQGHFIQGEVHDDNAFNIEEFTPHAGLFATPNGLIKNLLNLIKELNELNIKPKFNFFDFFLRELSQRKKGQRFCSGWDSVTDLSQTLSGNNADPESTIGHLGFTGTSLWIDVKTEMGFCLLTNATQTYSYDRAPLNALRKELSQSMWNYLNR